MTLQKTAIKQKTANILSIPQMPQLDISSETEIFADNHSLFIDKKQIAMEPVMDENNKIVEGFFEQTGGYTLYKLFLGEFYEQGNGVQRIISKLQEANPGDVLEFHIASRGGVIDELLEIYNLCDTIFYGNVTTFCNHAYSAGAMAFLFGEERYVYEHSDWMMHSWSGGFGGKRDDVLTHMEHEDKRLGVFFMDLMDPYFSKKEIKKMQSGKDFWLSSEEMLKRGIATHILKAGVIIPAQDYLEDKYPKLKTKRLKVEEKLAKKLAKETEKTLKVLKKGSK